MSIELGLLDRNLLRTQCYIDGTWRGADRSAPVVNPASNEQLGCVPLMSREGARTAIEAAARALPAWAAKTAKERAILLRRWFDLIMFHQEDLARILTGEQGKPLAEARGEIAYAASFIEWFAEEGKRVYGDVIPSHAPDKRILVLRQPIGVVAAITPWNFPAAMITRKCGPALAAGCTFVCKPALETPLSAFALAELAHRAGIPRGVFNIITGDAQELGREMTDHPAVRKLTFTGSTGIGRKLMAQCAEGIKKVSLELGGNAPFVVFDDAHLPAAVAGAIASKFRNSGQTCVCTNRLLVQAGVYEEFLNRLENAVLRLRVGDALLNEVDQGPLISESAVRKVERCLADAVAKGASIVTGGHRHQLGGTFFEPTVVRDARPDMLLAQEEIFGPVAPVFRFDTESEAIALANATDAGLAAYVYTTDLARAWRVSEALEVGMVGLNTGLISTEVAPFGGVKTSGIGREGSRYGIGDYVEMKYLCLSVE
jgi:succinate-semialdehyde dehydrogenase / glutarate-semialdehyde dehydrogenase